MKLAQNSSKKDLRFLLHEATQKIKRNDYKAAILTLKTLLDSDPKHEIALGMLASTYLQIGMHQQAIDLYERLLDERPNLLAQAQLGIAYAQTSQAQKALETLEPTLGLEGEFVAHFYVAQSLMQLHRFDEAKEKLAIAAQRMPSSHPLFANLMELENRLNRH